MVTGAELVERIEPLLESLRHRTGACRTTLRVDVPALDMNVNNVWAESVREGLRSLKGETSIDQRKSVAIRWLDRNRRVFIERDCLNADPDVAPEPEVIEIYGVRAEMVAPLVRAGELVGAVSVHYSRGARDWQEGEIATLEATCTEILALLEEVPPAPGTRTP